MKVNKKRYKINLRIVFVFGCLFAVGFGVLIWRLASLQIVKHTYYADKAAMQQFREETLPAKRGVIYDRNMSPLAESAEAWDVAVSPAYIKNGKQRNNIADNLSRMIGTDRNGLYNKINNKKGYVVVAKKVARPAEAAIRKYIKKYNLGCISLVQDSKRYYPFGNFASQLLGFTGANGEGLVGLEAEYNDVLDGVPGKSISEKNANGGNMPYDTGDYISAKNGDNIVLTIDQVIQQDLESDLRQALAVNNVTKRVTGIVMDVNTGEILGMATEPGFDPNDPFEISDPTVKKQLSTLSGDALKTALSDAQQTQWRNKAISEPYEPGSTFKIITAAGALEEGVVNENTQFYDPGYITIAGTTIKNWEPQGEGNINFLKGFEDSNDTVFIKVGEMLGASNFFKYYSDFGLTEKTGIDLPGEAESIYHNEKELGPVQLASEAFGQSDKITAIQLITAVSASANGGYLVQPHVVKEETDSSGNVVKCFNTVRKRQVISTETSNEIDKMLNAEVSIGTGKNAYVAGYRIGGKTGTSQKLDDKTEPDAVVSSMVSVAPTDNPQVAVLMVMDDPHSMNKYGGVIAAPVIGNIMSQILPTLGVEPKYTPEELASLNIKTPNLIGRTVSNVQDLLKRQGLNVVQKGNGNTVTGQMPQTGNPIPKSGTVIIYTNGEQIENSVSVPQLIGLTPSQVSQTLAGVGLNSNLLGAELNDSGVTSYEQDKAAGTKVAPGTVVSVKFRNNNMNVN